MLHLSPQKYPANQDFIDVIQQTLIVYSVLATQVWIKFIWYGQSTSRREGITNSLQEDLEEGHQASDIYPALWRIQSLQVESKEKGTHGVWAKFSYQFILVQNLNQ